MSRDVKYYYPQHMDEPPTATAEQRAQLTRVLANRTQALANVVTFNDHSLMIVSTPHLGAHSDHALEMFLGRDTNHNFIVTFPPEYGKSAAQQMLSQVVITQSSYGHGSANNKHHKRNKPLSHFELLAQKKKFHK